MSVSQLITEINNTYHTNKQEKFNSLTKLLSVNPAENGYIASIYNNTSTSQLKTLYDDDWPAFPTVVSSFVKLCNEMDPWSVLQSFDLYTTYLNDLSVAFNNNNFGWLLSGVIKSTIGIVTPWALQLDTQMFFKENGGKYRLNYIASVILKIFNNIRINSNAYKESIILYLGNKLCFIYWKLDNPLLCRNIFSNMNNTNLQLADFPMVEQLKYRYYLARYYFIKYELIESFELLKWCLIRTSSGKNQQLILELFIPISLVIGKTPNFIALKQSQRNNQYVVNFLSMYEEMSKAIRPGDYALFKSIVEKNHRYLKSKNLLLLTNKMEILIYRNLVKNCWKILGRQTTMPYNLVPIQDIYFKENLFVTLIDSNLIKGKLTNKSVVLSKNDPFPKVFDIYMKRFKSKYNQWM
ncbi:hypothetical protein CORT_0A06090 [Candida orthopsilosis Co 90-125]|uniref:PCI domain-containing protein n=1 Tax=Candida orthopsilosis (strain 90-125) TaxID=1136231 RepID=H8WY49_CANO9|nr:hypothetical protein CORT_0A06090 [Candida orthopsilosis Co 90-125]CCG20996.1 hypothetical protein CORT_0A06090 [Candida orthopsilosis Co 90-125]